ncbi:DUF3008 family protein [Pseudooctadecabacter jejudonensis]|uniref:Uncharacterized protein n=1 Tax=Pseudooctadecabacter jejudonensis TaxID=1391910 RepID=A0A1Y5SHF5_9RHOB|nr:DUF3008 family protein [Pseudooctadecabacter jejudonensis]SLN39212.1 hypothetical protein PSJ8397_01935 [Pseudooctadecabacter jejudonensis]
MHHFQHHRTNAQAALTARRGEKPVTALTPPQAEMFSYLTLAELHELSTLGDVGARQMAVS